MNLQEYAECINVNLVLHYYWDRKIWQVKLEDTDVTEKGFTVGLFAVGKTPKEALNNYTNRVRNMNIVVGKYSDNIKKFIVPNLSGFSS